MKRTGLLLIFFLAIILSACSGDGYKNLSTEEAKKLVDHSEAVVLDVRTPEEFEEGHIPKATLIPLQELESRLGELDKDETYLVVCRSGNRSAQASELLVQEGFKKVYNMTGGMNTWDDEIEK
ncbi:rhodanese-like domain-containing protein [Robertmurraya andreesenii]|uniref:Rhodanese-related sulfurtransferase n=1 Tax=Anoxybacillus andreesenii TaxID=1325932 RepID=A0ABT9V9E9_9BACL|nr:rhodanese-like domain-containing protein [Robertmurraya andreesenii]MDQ0157582.1 rhodanese-related sulfurtransferase [Robertmurraya andreesenii]